MSAPAGKEGPQVSTSNLLQVWLGVFYDLYYYSSLLFDSAS